MVFDRRTISRGLDKRGNPGTQAMVQAGANRVHMGGKGLIQIYRAEDQEPENKATRKDKT